MLYIHKEVHMLLKKIISAVCVALLITMSTPVTQNSLTAADAAADNGFTAEEIEGSAVKPKLTVDSLELTPEEVREQKVYTINITVSDSMDKYTAVGIHVYWDSRLTIVPQDDDMIVKCGDAIEKLMINASPLENGFFAAAAATSESFTGTDGVMYSFDLRLPDDAAPGDKFDISIIYEEGKYADDLFTDFNNDSEGKLMQAWLFTKGITTTTTTTTTATSTTTTTLISTATTTASSASSTTSSSSTTTSTSSATSASTTTSSASATTTVSTVPAAAKGDPNNDGLVDARDASLTLYLYADLSSSPRECTAEELQIYDANGNEKIEAVDASIMLFYYSEASSGYTGSFEQFLKEQGY